MIVVRCRAPLDLLRFALSSMGAVATGGRASTARHSERTGRAPPAHRLSAFVPRSASAPRRRSHAAARERIRARAPRAVVTPAEPTASAKDSCGARRRSRMYTGRSCSHATISSAF